MVPVGHEEMMESFAGDLVVICMRLRSTEVDHQQFVRLGVWIQEQQDLVGYFRHLVVLDAFVV